jgi:hypothetical protein
MTAKDKAQELVSKFKYESKHYLMLDAEKCALIAVDELIYSHSQDTTDNQYYFWQEVKQEIEKL